MGSTALVFITVFYIIITIPCVGVAWLGSKVINELGRYPSKTPAIQMSVVFKLSVIEVVSFTLLLGFFKVLVAE